MNFRVVMLTTTQAAEPLTNAVPHIANSVKTRGTYLLDQW